MRDWRRHWGETHLSQCQIFVNWPNNFPKTKLLMETLMLNLIDFEKHRLELFRQQTDTLDGLMPMFRVAANLILEEMEPFRKYGREPHLDLSTCSQYIRLRLTVPKRPPRRFHTIGSTCCINRTVLAKWQSMWTTCGNWLSVMHDRSPSSFARRIAI